MYTLRLCHNLIGDAVDALFVCTHLDAENEVSHCPKAVEAVSPLHIGFSPDRRLSFSCGNLAFRDRERHYGSRWRLKSLSLSTLIAFAVRHARIERPVRDFALLVSVALIPRLSLSVRSTATCTVSTSLGRRNSRSHLTCRTRYLSLSLRRTRHLVVISVSVSEFLLSIDIPFTFLSDGRIFERRLDTAQGCALVKVTDQMDRRRGENQAAGQMGRWTVET